MAPPQQCSSRDEALQLEPFEAAAIATRNSRPPSMTEQILTEQAGRSGRRTFERCVVRRTAAGADARNVRWCRQQSGCCIRRVDSCKRFVFLGPTIVSERSPRQTGPMRGRRRHSPDRQNNSTGRVCSFGANVHSGSEPSPLR